MTNKFKYDTIAEILTSGNVKLTKYKSQSSGMTIYIAEAAGPLVGGYMILANETFDDDGLPHTLEHLVHCGSEKYPYKDVLDKVAAKCFVEYEKNAWTATDYNCYTVSTVGEEGFLKILPVYLDHILFPTLTDAAFAIEIHHINGEGEDAGVAYTEVEDCVKAGEDMWTYLLLRAMYPGHCGCKSDTFGRLENLRESTTNEKVRAYHKKFYRPENLCCIIVGTVAAEKVFEALNPVEESILKKGDRAEFVRPWQNPVPPLLESVSIEFEFPSGFNKPGVMVGWRGPSINDFPNLTAITILLDYFTESPKSPLKREFFDAEEALCSEMYSYVFEYSVTCFHIHFIGVPVSRRIELKDKLFQILTDITVGKEEVDIHELASWIKKKKYYYLSSMERDPRGYFINHLIPEFIYGTTVHDLENRFKEVSLIEKLFHHDAQFWIQLIRTYMLDGKHVTIFGAPDPKMSDKISEAERRRIDQQKEKLGPLGLEEMAKSLTKAREEIENPPPEEMLESLAVSSVKSIKFHEIETFLVTVESDNDDDVFSAKKLPCHFQVHSVHTNFVKLFVLIDISGLPLESRMHLPLLVNLFGKCAVERNGEVVPYEDVANQLDEDVLSIRTSLGFGSERFFAESDNETLILMMKVEEEKYFKVFQWACEILYHTLIEEHRLKSAIEDMVSHMQSEKRRGTSVASSLMKNLCFQPESNHWTSTVFRQSAFLSKLQQRMESNPNEIISKLNEIRDAIINPEKIAVHLAVSWTSIKEKMSPEKFCFKEFLPSTFSTGIMRSRFKNSSEYVQPISEGETKGIIIGIDSAESSCLLQTVVCPSNNVSDYASLLVLSSYFGHTEGPLPRQFCACSYSDSNQISISDRTGLISFTICESSDLVKDYEKAVNVINSHLDGRLKWDEELLAKARCSVILEVVEENENVSDIIEESVKAHCRNKNITEEVRKILEKVFEVTVPEMKRVGIQYLMPLLNPELSRCVITCNTDKVQELKEKFKKFSRKLTEILSLEDNFMYEY